MNLRPTAKAPYTSLIISFVMMLVFAGCSPLQKGWSAFEKDNFEEAKKEWAQSEEPALTKRADAATRMVRYAKKASKTKVKKAKVQNYIYVLNQNRWPKDKGWAERSPLLKSIISDAKAAVEPERTRIQNAYNANIKCGKSNYLDDEYEPAEKCFDNALANTTEYEGLWIKKQDTEAMAGAVKQAMEIRREMERERLAAIARQKAYEKEQARLLAEAKAKATKAAELEAIRIEEVRLKKEAAKKRRWMAFLKKGRPLKPLVAIVGMPSQGKGRKMTKGKTEKWQGAARFPTMKRRIKAEHVYALEIVVPATYKLSYLKNYSKGAANLLSRPQRIKSKKHYYTEGYKGKRFYTEIKNMKGTESKYKITATIYKKAVTN